MISDERLSEIFEGLEVITPGMFSRAQTKEIALRAMRQLATEAANAQRERDAELCLDLAGGIKEQDAYGKGKQQGAYSCVTAIREQK